jgi:anti-anti-sigma factor
VSGLVVSVSTVGDAGAACTVVRLAGEADVTTHALGEALRAEAANRPALLLVEMSGLRFIDSSALNAILRVHEDLLATGCELALVGPSGSVARVLRLVGADQMIPVYDSVEAAIESTPPEQGAE